MRGIHLLAPAARVACTFRILAALVLTLASFSSYAQDRAATGRVSGVLRDPTGAVVPAGTVELRGLDSNVRLTTAGDAEGRFAFEALAPGGYILSAVVPGFEQIVREVTVPDTAAAVVADVTLDIARSVVLVEVTAPAGARPLAVETDPRTPRQPIPAHDGADYLKTIPGFSVIRKGGADGDPVLRGMAGSRLGVLLDGESILGGCGNRMDPPTAYAYPGAYERITVLKGPQTVIHGPGNSAGVVLFERKHQRYEAPGVHVYASPAVGMFGRNDEIAEVEAGTRRVYMEASATRSAMGDYEDGRGQSVHSSYERWSLNGALGWTPDPATRIEVSGARSDGEAAYADRMMDGVQFSRENVGLRFERQNITPLLQNLEGQAFYNYVDHVMDNFTLRPFTRSMMMPYPSVSNPDRRTVGGKASATLQVSARTTATLGTDWQENRHSIRSSSNQTIDPYESHNRLRDAAFENAGAYGEMAHAVSSAGRLVAGTRFDWWTGNDERQTVNVATAMGTTRVANPTAGMRRRETLVSGFGRYEHDLAPGTTFYAGLGHAERAPDYWELISKETAASVSAFETQPERTTQLDAGILYRRGPLSGSVAMFASDVSDFILIQSNYVKTSTATGGSMSAGMGGAAIQRKATITRNIDASSWGGEATLAWDVGSGLQVDTSLAYVRGENDTDGVPLAQQPPLEGRLGLQYSAGRWSLGALTRLVAAQDRYALNQGNIVGQDLGPTANFGVFSLNGGWRPTRDVLVSAGVDNLLDTTYAEFISRSGTDITGFTTTTRVNEPGRTLWIKLDFRK